MRKLITAILIIFSVLGVSVAAVQIVNMFTDFRVTPVTSDVMAPEIPAGSLLFSEKTPERSLQVGDIVQIGDASQDTNLLGRVLAVGSDDGTYYNVTLKNDAQPLPESFPYKINDVSYVMTASVPFVGYVAAFLSSIFGFIALAVIALVAAWYYLFVLHTPFSPESRELKQMSKQDKAERKNTALFGQYGGAEEFKSWFAERNAT